MSDSEKWVEIARTIYAAQAVSWRDILIDGGLHVIVDPPPLSSDPYPTLSSGTEYEVFVRAEDEERAREILSSMSQESEEE